MNARTIVLSFVLCFFGVSVCYAADVNMGTWKLNEAKSTVTAGAPKNNTVVFAAAGDDVKVTVDGVDGAGKPTHNEWTGCDGQKIQQSIGVRQAVAKTLQHRRQR